MLVLRVCIALAISAVPALSQMASPQRQTAEPVAVIDTTLGRLRCKLFEKEMPVATSKFIGLADGTAVWTDPVSGEIVRGKLFYDGTRLYSIPSGVRGGIRTREQSGAPTNGVALDVGSKLRFDRPGRLAMRGQKGRFGGEIMILDHANSEDDGDNAAVFGQCDGESISVVTAISHKLATVDNRPEEPIAINHVAIVREGKPLPPLATDVPAAAVVPDLDALAKPAAPAPEPSGPTAIIRTNMGTLSCRMFTKESPIATGVFRGLAEGTKEWKNPLTHKTEHGRRYYHGMPFDRVIPDFVIQTGDYTGDISGATDIGFRFKNETSPGLSFDRPGRLAFGNNGPDTNNSEIFIAEHPMRRLDGGFTIIGQCDNASIELVQKIARVPRDGNNRPIAPVRIERIEFDSH